MLLKKTIGNTATITLLYVCSGTVWVILSDLLFLSLSENTAAGIFKDFLFIAVSALFLFLLLKKYDHSRKAFRHYMFKVFKTFPQAMWLYNCNTQKVHDINTAFARMFQLNTHQTTELSLKALLPSVEADNLAAFIRSHTHTSFDAGIREFKKKDGTPLFLQTQGYWLPYRQKGLVLLVSTNMDEYISTLTTVADQQEKLTTNKLIFEDIAWMHSHKLRKPVANILGYTAVAKNCSEDQLKDIITNINTQAQELDETIRMIVNKTYYSE